MDCHPGTKRFVGLLCLVSFHCNLMVLWLYEDRVSCGDSSCCQTLGGSRIVGASSLAGMGEFLFPKILSQFSPFLNAPRVYRMFGLIES